MTANIIQKVTHVESFKELLLEITKQQRIPDVIKLQEKVNGFYAEVSYQDLRRAALAYNYNEDLVGREPLVFASRQKMGFVIKPELIDNLGELFCLLSNFETAYEGRFTPTLNQLVICGELVSAAGKQQFNKTSSVLRKKSITEPVKFYPFCITQRAFSSTSKEKRCNFLRYLLSDDYCFNNLFESLEINLGDNPDKLLDGSKESEQELFGIDSELQCYLKQTGIEGWVWYTDTTLFTNNARTSEVIALKYPLIESAFIKGYSYAYTTRGRIITRVLVELTSGSVGQEVILGSGIDDNLRYLLEQTGGDKDKLRQIKLDMKAERRTETGAYLKPVISKYWKEGI